MFINIDVERQRHKLSKDDLSVLLEVPVSTLDAWVGGQRSIPAVKLRALSHLFGCSVDYLLFKWEGR